MNTVIERYSSLGAATGSRKDGKFVNSQNETLTLTTYYVGGNKTRMELTFSKDGVCSRGAISTRSEKEALKIINEGGFRNVNENIV